jgi:hypothetical protein
MAGFGLRSTASRSNEKFIDRLKRHMRRIDGMKVRTERIKLRRWQPVPKADGVRVATRQSRRAEAGPVGWSTQNVPVAGAVPYALPTSKSGSQGPLVYLHPTSRSRARTLWGKVFGSSRIARFRTSGSRFGPTTPGRWAQWVVRAALLAALHQEMLAAGTAGAAGVVFAFHVPGAVRGHGTRTTEPTTPCRPCSSAVTKEKS